ncbi:hypothetical protein Tco_0149972 [Tanacetum coccineum]
MCECGYRCLYVIMIDIGDLGRMDRLSKRKFGIVCHGKVVRIPLEGDEILRVHGERTQGVVKTLMNTKFRVDLVPGATPVAKSPYRLAPLEMQELSEQLQELQDEEEHGVHLKLELELLRKEKLYAKSSVKDKILATSSETSKVENTPAEMLRDLDQQMEKRADDGKANVVTDALSRKERVKPRRVRAMAMTIQYGVRGMILAAQSEAFKQENTTDKVVLIKEKLKAAKDRQKRCADNWRKPLEFEVGEQLRDCNASIDRYRTAHTLVPKHRQDALFKGEVAEQIDFG